MSDPFDAVFSDLEYAIAPRTAFAESLREKLLSELTRPSLGRRRSARALAIAIALILILAGVATATYFVIRHDATRPKAGSLTVVQVPRTQVSKVLEVLPGGRTRVVWRCPTKAFCGELTSFAWSPDGKRAAFTLDELGGQSLYVGLHILDLATGHDLHLPTVKHAQMFLAIEQHALGCLLPTQVAWSPDSRWLAYACVTRTDQHGQSRIFMIRADGTGPAKLATGVHAPAWPAWAPDGKRLAFAGANGIYTIALDGTGRRLVAPHGSAPAWSPDGSTIAYESPTGVRLVTPAGVDVTPQGRFAPEGLPAWSPDGSMLAVGAGNGTYLVNVDGTHIRRVTPLNGMSLAFGSARPAWYPGERAAPRRPTCVSCL